MTDLGSACRWWCLLEEFEAREMLEWRDSPETSQPSYSALEKQVLALLMGPGDFIGEADPAVVELLRLFAERHWDDVAMGWVNLSYDQRRELLAAVDEDLLPLRLADYLDAAKMQGPDRPLQPIVWPATAREYIRWVKVTCNDPVG